jgi:molecular chaperone DnaJ
LTRPNILMFGDYGLSSSHSSRDARFPLCSQALGVAWSCTPNHLEETMTTCQQCGGQGKIRCENCGGTGKVQIIEIETVSDISSNSETITCPKCDGAQWQLCPRCYGSGEVRDNETINIFDPEGRDT